MFWSCLIHSLLLILAWSSVSSLVISSSDQLALQAIKAEIHDDPHGALSNWNNSIHYCEWYGITCSRRHRHRVTAIDLKAQKLGGTLSPQIGNLSFLLSISLTMNNFYGPIPQEMGRLSRLRVVYLNNNSFIGEIPTNITRCSNLREINLIDNNLSGRIPIEFTSLTKLFALGLSKNEFKGSIPSFLGNLSSLSILILRSCSLTGNIPDDLCRIKGLTFLSFSFNSLTGRVPSCLYNYTHMSVFSVMSNQLDGTLPPDIGLTLPNIQEIYMGFNKLKGLIPLSLQNASKLERLGLSVNQFRGQVPSNLGRLQGLRSVQIDSNELGSTSKDDLNFITSLTNCSNLEVLTIFSNFLKGSLPNSIANLSTQMTVLDFDANQIYGSIPVGIGILVNLYQINFGSNYLTRKIPDTVGLLPKLRMLYLQENQLSGEIPKTLGNLTQLEVLDLSRNKLYGQIPPSLGKSRNLLQLDLHNNRLNGPIPKQVIGLSSLTISLDLSQNELDGSLPSQVYNLRDLVELDISNNRLSGHIPDALGNCITLTYLSMARNSFQGKIPQALNTLKGIETFDLSHNKLNGEIPGYLANFTSLTYLNLSYNDLEGSIPKGKIFANASAISIEGNSKLCGGVAELKLLPCYKRKTKKREFMGLKVVIPVILVSVSVVLFLCFIFMCCRRRVSESKTSIPSKLSDQHMRVSYAELLKATNSFSGDHLIGVGGYGSVYKGTLDQGDKVVAVKVLNLEQQGASKSFLSECNAMRNLRHRNLLKIITSCSSVDFQGNDFKALVFEFMPNGSLDEWLHPRGVEHHKSRNLGFLQRLNIAIGVASALDYLHHHCQPAMVHCDLKPSNILLDDDLTAHVADFGLAKIFSETYSQTQGNSITLKGSIGYVAPENGKGREASIPGDVYSYGILLLEMFVGKRPTDDMFQNGKYLRSFAEAALPEQVMSIVDPRMLVKESYEDVEVANQSDQQVGMQQCLVSVIKVGVACSSESPSKRMDIRDVLTELCKIRDHHRLFEVEST